MLISVSNERHDDVCISQQFFETNVTIKYLKLYANAVFLSKNQLI